jgi:hypothetical protein
MTMRKLCAAVTLLAMAPATSWAGDCLGARDANALKTATLQQELMVAALTCNDIALYNRFVISYREQLQQSDLALQSYFRRGGSIADYHAYKTRMANQSSLDSLHDPLYCQKAKTAFDDALDSGKSDLAEVVAARGMPDGLDACQTEAAAGRFSRAQTADRRN